MIALTHLVAALALGYMFEKPLMTTSIFSLVPGFDSALDFLYPFVSLGIMHSFLAAFIATGLVYLYTESRSSAAGCFIGYSSALLLEALTTSNIPLLFPVENTYSLGLAAPASLEINSIVLTSSICVVMIKKHVTVLKPY